MLRRSTIAAIIPCFLAPGPGLAASPREDGPAASLTQDERELVRRLLPGLPVTGPYQMPRYSPKLLAWARGELSGSAVAGADAVGANVNVSNLAGPQSTTSVAVDAAATSHLVAASSQTLANELAVYASSDGGVSWSSRTLALGGRAFQTYPGVAWDHAGRAYAVTLGSQPSAAVQVARSTDRGVTWGAPVDVDVDDLNDKPLLAVDAGAASPCAGNVYVAWDRVGDGLRASRSTDGGATWSASAALATGAYIGACPAVGPAGEVYVAAAAIATPGLVVFKSTDCGATFSAATSIAGTGAAFDIGVPAFCDRRALIYPALDVDRSTGARAGWVYAAFTDGTAASTCAASATDVRFSRSSDGGATWSAPILVHEALPGTDQFNPWLAVDPSDGRLSVAFHDTRHDASRLATHVYVSASTDGGATFLPSERVTSAPTDETCCGADLIFQYGDMSGIAAAGGVAHPAWTDRRGGADEEIYTATVIPTSVQPRDEIVTGSGPGPSNPPEVKIWSHATPPSAVATWTAFGAGGYGVNVGTGAIDGTVRVLSGPGPGAIYGPQVRAFAATGTAIAKVNFYAYGTLRFGVIVASGDVEADGLAEILTGAGPGAVFGPHVRGFNYDGVAVASIPGISFYAYSTLRYGVNPASASVDGDAAHEIATAPGPGAVFAPTVRGFNADGGPVTSIAKINFNAFPVTSGGGRVALLDVDADGFAEIATGKGPMPAHDAEVRVFDYDATAVSPLFTVNAYPTLFFGARVGGGDLDATGRDNLLVTPGPGAANPPSVTAYAWDGTSATVSVNTFPAHTTPYGANATAGDMGAI